ncbi:hypothetical protein AZ22_0292 [Bordetella bronchiseptica 980-2]|nr:hypothetical protein AZ22_0292 [Bordetella bronchiseptica 980-2]KDB86334.1 hypothetical protein AZ17_0403 [Bordetella bronchiseptica D989]KDB96708.1 hypothetical protein AZ18_0546 [Bordetella bronchiseptica D993]KDC02693.1 hypothetical protein AZ23_0408 [Bordetella bronchiseptica E010]KDC10014.1 hypothetical protein AZ19_0321 [Bordetella bronchiseptica E012]KDC11630.1 hypothetical protein AZ24_0412 [Bordetella bronchiseptica E013]KDC71137.1 hypothetical protein L512_0390 [Bordetella bronch
MGQRDLVAIRRHARARYPEARDLSRSASCRDEPALCCKAILTMLSNVRIAASRYLLMKPIACLI